MPAGNGHGQPSPETPHLVRSIGLSGSVAFVVGGVVGAGIYALIGPIAAGAGSAIWLAFILAILVSLMGAIPVIQLASALPRAGAGYLFASRLLFPMAGTVTSAWVILGGACSTCVVALALVGYLPLPAILRSDPHLAAGVVVVLFYLVLLFGVKLAIGLQVLMAAQMLLALSLYVGAGLLQVDLQFSFVPRGGATGFLMAVILCYNTCFGFQILAEMGEEIRDARRTIPLALLIGGSVVAVLYILVGTVFVSAMPFDPESYRSINAPLSASGARLLPPGALDFVNFGAVTAGLTSLNAAAIALPRELFAQARDGILPIPLSRVAPHAKAPLVALTVYFTLVVLLMLAQRDLDFYGYMAAVGIQVMTSAICIASLRLGRLFPEHYQSAYVRFPRWTLVLCAGITLAASAGFIVLIAFERPTVVLLYGLLTAGTAGYHRVRVRWLTQHGVPWQERVHAIPGEDEQTG